MTSHGNWTLIVGIVLLAASGVTWGQNADRDPFFSRWETFTAADGLPSGKVTAVVVDGPHVWAGTEEGLAVLEREGSGMSLAQVRTIEGLPFRVISALAVSPATGDLWVGTMGGLARVSGGRIDSFNQLNSGLANDVIYSVAVDGKDVWVATAAGLNRYDTWSHTWELFDVTNTLMHEPWCYGVIADGGTVHVAVWGGGVIVRAKGEKHFREHRDPDGEMEIDLFRDDGLVHDVTSGVTLDGGILWVGTYFGLSRYDGRRWRSFNQEDSGLAGDFINFVMARDGIVWIGTDMGLSRFDSKVWHTWRRTEAGEGIELVITEDETGAARSLSPAGGPVSNTIYGIDIEDDDIWLATARGLVHAVAHPPVTTTIMKRGDPR